jgi:hypothetical protein
LSEGAIHAFLAGRGADGRGRTLAEVLAFDDARVETVHDFVQWLFPLHAASRAVPGSPVLTAPEAAAIRADPAAREGLTRGLARMARFYAGSDGWLTAFDHNHLRITRILTAARDLLGEAAARDFHAGIAARDDAAGNPINPESRAFWVRALEGR